MTDRVTVALRPRNWRRLKAYRDRHLHPSLDAAVEELLDEQADEADSRVQSD